MTAKKDPEAEKDKTLAEPSPASDAPSSKGGTQTRRERKERDAKAVSPDQNGLPDSGPEED